jgi:hypothetical protein
MLPAWMTSDDEVGTASRNCVLIVVRLCVAFCSLAMLRISPFHTSCGGGNSQSSFSSSRSQEGGEVNKWYQLLSPTTMQALRSKRCLTERSDAESHEALLRRSQRNSRGTSGAMRS